MCVLTKNLHFVRGKGPRVSHRQQTTRALLPTGRPLPIAAQRHRAQHVCRRGRRGSSRYCGQRVAAAATLQGPRVRTPRRQQSCSKTTPPHLIPFNFQIILQPSEANPSRPVRLSRPSACSPISYRSVVGDLSSGVPFDPRSLLLRGQIWPSLLKLQPYSDFAISCCLQYQPGIFFRTGNDRTAQGSRQRTSQRAQLCRQIVHASIGLTTSLEPLQHFPRQTADHTLTQGPTEVQMSGLHVRLSTASTNPLNFRHSV